MSALLDVPNEVGNRAVLSDVMRGPLPAYAPTVLSGVMTVPPPQLGSVSLTIVISDFNLAIDAVVLQSKQDKDASEFSLTVSIAENVEAKIVLEGSTTEDETSFEIREVLFRLAPTEDGAEADFVASTLNAALTLSQRVHIQMPGIGLDLVLGFALPLIEISRLLQSRQTCYRLMTIERATGIRFDLPSGGFSGTDIGAILFVFRAIVDRAFTYHLLRGIPVVIEADEEGPNRLRSLQESQVITFGPEDMSKSLLGVDIPLGHMTVKISDPYIEDTDRVRGEIAQGDGHPVAVLIRSLTNQAVFELPEAPRLPPDPWDERIQALISLEENLDSHLFARYNALAAGSLDGLSEEEKKRITTRPKLQKPSLLEVLRDKVGL